MNRARVHCQHETRSDKECRERTNRGRVHGHIRSVERECIEHVFMVSTRQDHINSVERG